MVKCWVELRTKIRLRHRVRNKTRLGIRIWLELEPVKNYGKISM